jgi:hypothetical protein
MGTALMIKKRVKTISLMLARRVQLEGFVEDKLISNYRSWARPFLFEEEESIDVIHSSKGASTKEVPQMSS